MRLHTDTLTHADVRAAVILGAFTFGAPIHLSSSTSLRSRSRHHAYELRLTSDGTLSRRRPNSGTGGAGEDYAATWDQWGVVLGELFRRDPRLTIPRVYVSPEHYGWSTDWRFETDRLPELVNHNHRWNFAGIPREQECACGAVRRWGER